MLRFPAARLWPDPSARPEPFNGTVWPVGENQEADSTGLIEINSPEITEEERRDRAHPPETKKLTPPDADTSEPPRRAKAIETGDLSQIGEKDAGEEFLHWLGYGLANHRFPINTIQARLHVATEGLLLLSPGIFKDFDADNWTQVQKRFQKLKLHRKTPEGTNIFTYTVKGERRQSRIKVIVIPEPERVFPDVTFPAPNPYLTLDAV